LIIEKNPKNGLQGSMPMTMLAMVFVMVPVMVMTPVIESVEHGAQVIEVQAGVTFHCGIDDLKVCR
jgi:hypothetical protein